MPTLITGGGLVGSQIARLLVEKGEKPLLYDVSPQLDSIDQIVSNQNISILREDVLDLGVLQETIKREQVETVIHTAANPMLTVGAQERPYDAIKLNILGTANVLEAARKLDLKKVVFTSSSVLYSYRKGGLENGCLSEDNFPRTTTIYASTKLACENLGLNYNESYGIDFVALRFQAVFGPWNGQGGGGPSNMFKAVIENALKGEKATISSRSIEFVYSKDAARSTILAAEGKGLTSRIYNVGMGKIYTPTEIIDIIRAKLPSAQIEVEEMSIGKPATIVQEPADSTRSKQELGYVPMYDMTGAIEDYIDWYRAHGK